MTAKSPPYKKLRIFFLILFLGSIMVMVGIGAYSFLVFRPISNQATLVPPTSTATPTRTPTRTATPSPTFSPVPTRTPSGGTSTPGGSGTEIVVPTSTATQTPTPSFTPTLTPTHTPTLIIQAVPDDSPDNPALSILTGPLFTAMLGLLGFVSTTVLQWRKEARDARVADLERKQLELEYEKKKRELEKPGERTKPGAGAADKVKPPGLHGSPARLIGLSGETRNMTFSLEDGAVIGRSQQSKVRLSDPSVSRQHARLRFGGDRWFIQDMKSAGGVYVNGKRVDATALKDGDRVRIGKTEFEFREKES